MILIKRDVEDAVPYKAEFTNVLDINTILNVNLYG